MRLPLKQFQEDTVNVLVRQMRFASRDARGGDPQSICLSSTTGSGKTVMMTSAIEQVIRGDDGNAPFHDATFLWVTDQPELNEQTRRKMSDTSSILGVDSLIVVDNTFDQDMFSPASVYFLNIQKLGKDKGLVTAGDNRNFTIWQTIGNTVAARPGRFFVILDEAHRGMAGEKDEAEAASIAQKFIKGSSGELAPVPIVIGVSATPERFNRLISGSGRTNRSIDVDVNEVRLSGLIKDTIALYHPKREQPSDMTLLREAAKSLQAYSAAWGEHCAKYESSEVVPLLVVQVADARTKGQVSDTDIPEAIRVLRDELGSLDADAFAHSFQEGTTLNLESGPLRYVSPSDIQNDPNVRVVFFKTSLNTGWDCPRAEVIMSFRSAVDATSIAQLVGRMVRTPFARRIASNDELNTVSLYLPNYNADALRKIIQRLSKPDSVGSAVDIEFGDDIVVLKRAPGSVQIFEALSRLPSYIVPRKRKANQVRRLMKLARLLVNDDIDHSSIALAKTTLLDLLDAEYAVRQHSERFMEVVEERGRVDIDSVNWEVGTEVTAIGESTEVDISAEDVDDLFNAAGRKLNEGLHLAWWRRRVTKFPTDRRKAKLELFALCMEPDVMRKLEVEAQSLVQKWLVEFSEAIKSVDQDAQNAYAEIRNLAAAPELVPLIYPDTIRVRRGPTLVDKHVYIDEQGEFSVLLNRPELDTVRRFASDAAIPGWLRNPDRKAWSVCVPYVLDGEDRAMYPDFLAARTTRGGMVIDLIEPHSISLADAPQKAAGLARFAARHIDKFGRIELILVDGSLAKTIDLTNEALRGRVAAITLPSQLKQLFSET